MGAENAFSTSVAELNKQDYTVFPNPTSGNLNIVSNKRLNLNSRLDVFDLQGHLVHSQKVYSQSIDLGFLPAGAYILNLTDQTNKTILLQDKLIIQPK